MSWPLASGEVDLASVVAAPVVSASRKLLGQRSVARWTRWASEVPEAAEVVARPAAEEEAENSDENVPDDEGEEAEDRGTPLAWSATPCPTAIWDDALGPEL